MQHMYSVHVQCSLYMPLEITPHRRSSIAQRSQTGRPISSLCGVWDALHERFASYHGRRGSGSFKILQARLMRVLQLLHPRYSYSSSVRRGRTSLKRRHELLSQPSSVPIINAAWGRGPYSSEAGSADKQRSRAHPPQHGKFRSGRSQGAEAVAGSGRSLAHLRDIFFHLHGLEVATSSHRCGFPNYGPLDNTVKHGCWRRACATPNVFRSSRAGSGQGERPSALRSICGGAKGSGNR